jgi:YegS/Rv2252/BmrU family lipid kinase
MRAIVIVNPIAGPGRRRTLDRCAELARSVLATHGYTAHVVVTESPTDASRFARDAIQFGADLVVAWGGDGTINGAGSALAGASLPLGIVPAGSGNGLARDLGLPQDPARALAVAATGRERGIDAGDLQGSLFFNVAGIGLDAEIAALIAQPGARRGLAGYVMATFQVLRRYEPELYTIRIGGDDSRGGAVSDEATIEKRALMVALANSRQYGNGAQIAPRAELDDGAIDVVVVEARPFLAFAPRLPAFFRGTLEEAPDLLMRRATHLSISSRRPIRFHVDGEPRTGPETLTLRVHPRALRVRVP